MAEGPWQGQAWLHSPNTKVKTGSPTNTSQIKDIMILEFVNDLLLNDSELTEVKCLLNAEY